MSLSARSWGVADVPAAEPRPAPFSRRAVTTCIDVMLGVALVIGITWALQGAFDYDLHDLARHAGAAGWASTDRHGVERGLASALGLVAAGVVAADSVGGSPAKRIAGLRVAREATGGHLGLPRSALRLVGRPLAAVFCWVGYLVAVFDPRGRTWCDRIAGSVVVVD